MLGMLFCSLEFRIWTCGVSEGFVLTFLFYLLVIVWFLVRSWRGVRLWEFSRFLLEFFEMLCRDLWGKARGFPRGVFCI